MSFDVCIAWESMLRIVLSQPPFELVGCFSTADDFKPPFCVSVSQLPDFRERIIFSCYAKYSLSIDVLIGY